MCNLTAPPPDRPAAKRHKCGTIAARRRCRTAKSAAVPRTKVSTIRYLCGPNCGIFSGAGTGWPRLCPILTRQIAPNRSTHLKIPAILATCFMHHFSCPKFKLTLPFSPPGLALRPLTGVAAQLAVAPAGKPGLPVPEAVGSGKPGAGRDFCKYLCPSRLTKPSGPAGVVR